MDNRIHVAQIIGRVAEGGVESMIMNLYRNIDHSKVVFDFYVENTSLIINEEEINSYGGKVYIIPSYKNLYKFKKTLKNYFTNNCYDIVHANMNALSFIPLKVAKQCGIKHRIAHSHSTSNKKELLKHLLKAILRPFSRKYATDYFACSKKAGEWLFGHKLIEQNKVVYINNGVDIDQFGFSISNRNEVRKELGIDSSTFVIGHVGRFCRQKNQEYLIDVFEKIQTKYENIALIFIGCGETLEKCKKLVRDRKIKNIIFKEPTKDVNRYYSAFDCFALPSLYEGLPVVGVEAQANGLKCFFSKDITEEAKILPSTEIVDLDNKNMWINTISNYLDNYKGRDALLNHDILSSYDIKSISNKLLLLYQGMLKE